MLDLEIKESLLDYNFGNTLAVKVGAFAANPLLLLVTS
jgi:hypothetical protein